MNINLHIERLVLDGVDISPDQGDLLQASVINELTQLFNGGVKFCRWCIFETS